MLNSIVVSAPNTPRILLEFEFDRFYLKWNIVESEAYSSCEVISIEREALLSCLIRCIAPELPGPSAEFHNVGRNDDIIWRYSNHTAAYTRVREGTKYLLTLHSLNFYIHPQDRMIVIAKVYPYKNDDWSSILEFTLPNIKKMLRFVHKHKEK